MGLWSRLFGSKRFASEDLKALPAADGRVFFDGDEFNLGDECAWVEGLPHPDFRHARAWIDHHDDESYSAAWLQVQRTWLAWLASHLGDGYRVHETDDALLLTNAEPRMSRIALGYLSLTQRRVARSLAKLASERFAEKPVVLMLECGDDYYRYLSGMHPEEGEFPMSAGVHFNGAAPHFAVNGTDLSEVEATIVHEMTHAFVAHLPIPLWLNEGLAVNMEIAFGRAADGYHLQELEKRHRKFWTTETIQDFWSGRAYERTDECNELAYDLGRLLVAGMCSDWARFEAFALEAQAADAGAGAAEIHLGIGLGEYVRHYLLRGEDEWAPAPGRWAGESMTAPVASTNVDTHNS
jgi:hypothetical protein